MIEPYPLMELPEREVFANEGEVFFKPQLMQVTTPPIPPPQMEDAEEEDDD